MKELQVQREEKKKYEYYRVSESVFRIPGSKRKGGKAGNGINSFHTGAKSSASTLQSRNPVWSTPN